jgi:hypothetical protein
MGEALSSASAHPRGRLRRSIDAHLGSGDVARVIYGSIIGLALVVALENHPPTAGQTVGAVLGTALAVGLADIYSGLVGAEARTRRPVHLADAGAAAKDASAVMFGAGFPAVFFILAAAGAMELSLAYTLSKWTGFGLICVYGLLAGRLSGSSWSVSIMHALAVAAIGGFLIAFKALLH